MDSEIRDRGKGVGNYFMPKLVVIVNYFEVPEVHKEDLEFRIYSTDGVKVAEVKIKRSALDAHFAANSLSENDEALISVEVPFIFLPMVVQKPGVLKVRMFDGAQEVKLGSLVFKSGPPPILPPIRPSRQLLLS